MPTDIHHLGPQNSDAALDIRVYLVELGHDTADGRLFFDQVDFMTGIGNIQRRLDAGHTATCL